MRGYCLLSTKKDVTYFGIGSDAYETLFKGIQYRMNTTELIQSGLLEFFSAEEAKQIIKASELPAGAVTRLCGKSMWVPISRLKYLPVVVSAIAMALAFAIPMGAKSVSVFGFEVPAAHVIFPWVYIFTDLTNELFGYQMTKRCIRYLAFLLVMMAVLIQLSLLFKEGDTISATLFSDATSDEIIRGFDAIYTGLPQTILIYAGCLLIADTFNAYVFAQLKEYMNGQKLWFRSLCSNCFASITYTLVFSTLFQLCCWEWPSPETMTISHLIATMVFKLPYFLAALPLIYRIRKHIRGQEAKVIVKIGLADSMDDDALRAAEKKDYSRGWS